MQLTLRDRVFPIESATLSAGMWDPYWSKNYNNGIPPRLTWMLELKCALREHDETSWGPHLYHDNLIFPSRNWRDIAGQRREWTSALDAKTGDHNGCMYVFEHADIHEGALSFGAWSGRFIDVSWRGVCDVFWDEGGYGRRVPFAATAHVGFRNVLLHGNIKDTEASYRDRFAQHLNPDDFDQGEIAYARVSYEDGMEMTSCIFSPKQP